MINDNFNETNGHPVNQTENLASMQPADSQSMSISLASKVEALLFAAPGAVTTNQLASAIDTTPQEIEEAVLILEKRYQTIPGGSGLALQRFHGRIQLTSSASAAELIERFLGLEATSRLSRAGLETLAIIAYQEPVTRPQVDAIRGVNSDGVLKSLLHKGLIQEVGRAEAPGRPILYSVTSDFLQHFGINSLAELPPLEDKAED